jgi:hypothetical protein
MTWEGPFFVQMYGGYVESLGTIHDCKEIAETVTLLISRAPLARQLY